MSKPHPPPKRRVLADGNVQGRAQGVAGATDTWDSVEKKLGVVGFGFGVVWWFFSGCLNGFWGAVWMGLVFF